jgi:DNA-binding CsgD family transcriptional regulator
MIRFDSSDLIEQVYDASLSPELWDVVLERLLVAYDARFGALGVWDHESCTHLMDLRTAGLTPSLDSRFRALAYSGESNPFLEAVLTLRSGEVRRAESLVSGEAWAECKMNEEIARPTGVRHGVGLNLTPPGVGMGSLSLFRDATAGPFSDADLLSAEQLAPHIVRATRLMHRLSELRAKSPQCLACEALESFAVPVFVTTASGRVEFVNQAGRNFAAADHGVRIIRGQLEATEPRENTLLAQLIHQAALARKNRYSDAGGSISLTTRGSAPMSLLVVPLGPGRSRADWPSGELALVVASRPLRPGALAQATLRGQFGLTVAETRVALLLAEGAEPKDVADRLGVAVTTARTHLQHLFDKTSTKRQAELVRLLLSHPALAVLAREEQQACGADGAERREG